MKKKKKIGRMKANNSKVGGSHKSSVISAKKPAKGPGRRAPQRTVPGPAKSGGKREIQKHGTTHSPAIKRKTITQSIRFASKQEAKAKNRIKAKRSAAARKGWQTRRKEQEKRSLAAKKGWQTRRRRQRGKEQQKKLKPKRPNQEYIVTVIATAGKKKRAGRQWDLFVIGPHGPDMTDERVIEWTVWYVANHQETKKLEYLIPIIEETRTQVIVARGPLAHQRRTVKQRL